MHLTDAHNALADWFRRALQQEIIAGDEIGHYLESISGSTDLATALATLESTEVDSLLDLLFFPDTPLQLQFEKQWGDTPFCDQDRDRLLDRLASEPMRACIRMKAGGACVFIDVPAFIPKTFVQRMNITWQPPSRLRDALEKQLAEKDRMSVRVRLRNTPLAYHAGQCDLLCDFLRAVAPADRTFDACLDLLLCVLDEFADGRPPYPFLTDKKRSWFHALCNAEAFERKRQSANMETLMMRGERAAYGDISQLRRQMRLMDTLCMALFGRTEFFQSPMEHSEQIELTGDDRSMDTIVSKLML